VHAKALVYEVVIAHANRDHFLFDFAVYLRSISAESCVCVQGQCLLYFSEGSEWHLEEEQGDKGTEEEKRREKNKGRHTGNNS
jgi:hypothetical protein